MTGIVLAGGRSERFGEEFKAGATLDGHSLIERVVRSVRASTGNRPVVAAGPHDKRTVVENALVSAGPVRFVTDADWCSGPVAGLCAAVDVISTDHVFVCGCDMPLLSPAAVSWLLSLHSDSDVDATIPVDSTGCRQPLHGVYRRSTLAAQCDRQHGSNSLHAFVSGLSVRCVEPSSVPDCLSLEASMTNVNTRERLDALRQRPED
ncbi:molybdenum cofactor guanylyltransferase [Haloferax denitrificans]|uniref:Molybdopterin-guanine dinucleotide biosynthesis protein A n=1 Tax=Haloferax denitrificans ATCC 35960 TaxID=662478 RepID=M0JJU0_9EURY|nr:molybdenum cofactor guanylyltransferase [Haloferax denitrificans]EMA07955.1 molybdopterin-guanine dinucleotide biosynthesis protein A [Haloferax denitrificans ATCC 35960]